MLILSFDLSKKKKIMFDPFKNDDNDKLIHYKIMFNLLKFYYTILTPLKKSLDSPLVVNIVPSNRSLLTLLITKRELIEIIALINK